MSEGAAYPPIPEVMLDYDYHPPGRLQLFTIDGDGVLRADDEAGGNDSDSEGTLPPLVTCNQQRGKGGWQTLPRVTAGAGMTKASSPPHAQPALIAQHPPLASWTSRAKALTVDWLMLLVPTGLLYDDVLRAPSRARGGGSATASGGG